MSKISKYVKEQRKAETERPVENFMGGISYEYDPIETLKMVTASSVFGEPQYYRDGRFSRAGITDGVYNTHRLFSMYSVLPDKYNGMKTSELMEMLIDEALGYDFGAAIEWAAVLRNDFNMRLNPQIIMVRAAIHPKRKKFNEENPGVFSALQKQVMKRADEPVSQLEYYLFKHGSKKGIPGLLKRNWASRLEACSVYELHKYKNSGIGMIDTVRICHANSRSIDTLMTTGTVAAEDDDNTWEAKRAAGTPWRDILSSINMGHMALLRNLRGIFTETEDADLCRNTMQKLKDGVLSGRQFPFRYFTAMKVVERSDVHHKGMILDTLEECMDISCDNMPRLKGRTMCLSDNSGSAWGGLTSEYGSVTVAEIDNLSSLITARNSDEGYIGKFGDDLIVRSVSKRNGLLAQCKELSENEYDDVGGATENGIWIFFRDAIDKKEHWDNIFIYSDQQAGHGGLYSTKKGMTEYKKRGFAADHFGRSYVDAAKLISEYRKKVNPDVNVFSVQTAGYNNVLVPEYGYRTNLLYGWTGRELVFADQMISFWDKKQSDSCKAGYKN